MKNGDLVVLGARADQLSILAFASADSMTTWEYAAYDAYGQERCDKEAIWELRDLFGLEFEEAFFAHKYYLLAKEDLAHLLEEQERLTRRLKKYQTKCNAYLRSMYDRDGLPHSGGS